MKCLNCGSEMMFLKVTETDTNVEDLTMYIVERWECEECENINDIEFTGKIQQIREV